MPGVIWCGGLPKGTKEDEVEDFFRKYRDCTEVQIRSGGRDTFAFVTFADEREAEAAIHDLNQTEFQRSGYNVKLERSNKQAAPPKRRGGGYDDRDGARGGDRQGSQGRARSRSRSRSRGPDRRERDDRGRSSGGDGGEGLFTAWMGGLPRGCSEEEIEDFVRGFGRIRDIRIRSSERDVFAFVSFDDSKLGAQAVEELNQTKWSRSNPCVIQMTQSTTRRPRNDRDKYRSLSPRKKSGNYRLSIKYLPDDMTWSELKDIGREAGESISFSNCFVKSGVTCGVLEYKDRKDAEYAYKKLNDRRISGCSERLQVKWGEDERR